MLDTPLNTMPDFGETPEEATEQLDKTVINLTCATEGHTPKDYGAPINADCTRCGMLVLTQRTWEPWMKANMKGKKSRFNS